ncbi:helix-turn-helix domain-containing protein [Acidovorax sp.]|uniref:helix-turn-helix domain-containing protein n=1 Tax=Acidovorax sp. TaxID=1872122 RepID=UPI00391C93DD
MNDGVTAEAGVTAGTLLKDARQASGMHIAALAVALKVPVSKLEALEADNYAVLPDTVFVRALASSVCRTLKVDPAPIMALLPQSQSPRLNADAAGINAPVKGRSGKSSPSSFAGSSSAAGSTSRSVAVVVLALLAGALALVYFPRSPSEGERVEPMASEGSRVTEPVQAPIPAAEEGAPVAEGTASLPSGPLTQPAPQALAVAPTAPPATAAVASAPAAAPAAAAPPASAPAPVAASGILQLRARSESWVQVKDSSGAIVLQRNLAPAEVVSVSGSVPLAVVVGRADATEVFVRGKPFELSAVARENVARFEVK